MSPMIMCLVAQSCPTLCNPLNCNPPSPSLHGDCLGKNTGSGLPRPPPRDLPNPGVEPRSPALQADSLPSNPTREAPQNMEHFTNTAASLYCSNLSVCAAEASTQ